MPHRILVVDDEEAIRTLVRDALEAQGMRVYMANDFKQAMSLIGQKSPQLALIDFLLPKKNGFALAEAIRGNPDTSQMPLIMMSGVFKNPRTAAEAREKFQVIEFLSKPLDIDRLGALIKRTLRDVPELPEDEEPEAAGPAPGSKPPPDEERGVMSELSGAPPPDPAMAPPSIPPPRGLSYGRPAAHGPSVLAPSTLGGAGSPLPAPARAGGPAERAFPPMPSEGELERHPVALLISILRHDELTGMLDLAAEGTHRRLYVLRGQPIFMQSNADGENVGALLLRRGRITEPDFDRCLDYMKAKKRTLQQALLDLRLATEADLATAYKLLAGQLLPMAIGMPAGTFKWRETDAFVGRVPEGNFEPVSVLFDGIKRHVHPPQILKFFKGREDIPLRKTAQFEALLPYFRRAFSANNIAGMIDGRATYRDISRARTGDAAAAVPQLFALVTSGMTFLPTIDADNELDVAVNEAAAEVASFAQNDPLEMDDVQPTAGPGPALSVPPEGGYTPEEEKARQRITKAFPSIMSKSFFDIFGARPDNLDLAGVKDQYFKLAKQWHNDAFIGLRLGDAQRQLDEMFSRITEAYETLNDPAKRSEYMVFLDRQSKGLPTDINQVFEAERIFDEGLRDFRRRDYRAAHEKFQKATELNSGEPIFWAHLGYVVFLLDQSSQQAYTEAVQLIKKAVGITENVPAAYQFMGQIFMQRGQAEDAKRWFQKALEWDPGNIEVTRSLRLISQRSDKNSKSTGLLSRFLSKK
ncbi:MAG: response regulator [Deltaproteobacteria bacterium]|nr:response regulator [Deltaproteobacteria bacterium]